MSHGHRPNRPTRPGRPLRDITTTAYMPTDDVDPFAVADTPATNPVDNLIAQWREHAAILDAAERTRTGALKAKQTVRDLLHLETVMRGIGITCPDPARGWYSTLAQVA